MQKIITIGYYLIIATGSSNNQNTFVQSTRSQPSRSYLLSTQLSNAGKI